MPRRLLFPLLFLPLLPLLNPTLWAEDVQAPAPPEAHQQRFLFDLDTATKSALYLLNQPDGRYSFLEIASLTKIDESRLIYWKSLLDQGQTPEEVFDAIQREKTMTKTIVISVLGAANQQFSREISIQFPANPNPTDAYKQTVHYLVYTALGEFAKGANLEKSFDNAKVVLIYRKHTPKNDEDAFYTTSHKLEWESHPLLFWHQLDHWTLHRRRVIHTPKCSLTDSKRCDEIVAVHVAIPGVSENIGMDYLERLLRAIGSTAALTGVLIAK